jgi:hypothetical protein
VHAVAPSVPLKRPAGQLAQLVLPALLLKLPARQRAQVDWPVALLKRPAGQSTAGAIPPAQEEPAGHSVTAVTTSTPKDEGERVTKKPGSAPQPV